MTDQGSYKKIKYINYEQLRKSFMKELFDELSLHLNVFGNKTTFYRAKHKSYRNHTNGFYVYAPPNQSKQSGQKKIINYILRYTGRPVMAQSRIEAYDKQSQIIQYWYEPHDSDEIVHVTENVLVFIVSSSSISYLLISKVLDMLVSMLLKTKSKRKEKTL